MAPTPGERPRDAREVRTELERIEPAAVRSLAERLRTELVVGRERELARLERWLARAPEGAAIVALSGEPGAGKSALLAELAVRASLAGRCVIRLSCALSAAPGAVAVAMLRRLAAEARADSSRDAHTASALSLLERSEPIRESSELALLADAAIVWARRLAQRGATPLVLLDDREELETVSAAMLRRILFHPQARSLRVLWTGRGELGGAGADDRMLFESGTAESLALAELEPAALERLVAARLLRPAPRDLLEFLRERAGGNPGLVVELMRVAAERGALKETEASVLLDAEALQGLTLPEDFEVSLTSRLVALPAPSLAAARALAVLSRPALAEELCALAPTAGVEALAELRQHGLARLDESGRFALSPPALASIVLASCELEERQRLHRAALVDASLSSAERFAHLRGAGDAEPALEAGEAAFASHPEVTLALQAADLAVPDRPARAAAWLERAATLLIDQGRQVLAIPHLERALALEPEAFTRFWRRRLLSGAYVNADRLDALAALIAQSEEDETPAREMALILNNASARFITLGQPASALECSRRAVELANESASDESVGYAEMGMTLCLARELELTAAAAHARRAIEAFARASQAGGRSRALVLAAYVARSSSDHEAEESLTREALDVAREGRHRHASHDALLSLGSLQVGRGRWSQAQASFAEAHRIALEDGRPHGVVLATCNLALLDALTGRPSRARVRANRAIQIARRAYPSFEPFAWRDRAQALRIEGRYRAAESAVWRGLELAGAFGERFELNWLRIEYVRLCAGRLRWRQAGEAATRARTEALADDPIGGALLTAWVGRTALRRRDVPAADAEIERCAGIARAYPAPYAEAHLLQLRAERALAVGELDPGTELARAALDAFAALPAPPDRAMAALEFARLAHTVEARSGVPVGEWLHEAAATFERLGDLGNRARALALLVEWQQRTRVDPAAAAHERDLLQSVSTLIDSLADVPRLERRAMQLAVEHLEAERGVLLLNDPRTGLPAPVVEHGAVDAATRDRAVSYSHRIVERVARSGGSLLIADAPSHPDMMSESVVGLGLRSILCVPLFGGGHVIGAVYVDDSRRPDAFSREDRSLLEGFAHLMATAIEKSRGHDEVRRANEQLVGENLELRREARARFQPHNFVGQSLAMQSVLAVVERAAQTNTTVLVTGENGTGKELIARILHHSGRRHLKPFVGVNCGAIPEHLIESELFGILPNVASGVRGRDGRFVQANGGTLFLDEIGEMPMEQQVALLAVLANREITPVGGGPPIPIDVRIIAATNRDLRRSLEEGSFREDLFYRLNVIPIEVPPLREHKADIPAMAHHFAEQIARQLERETPELSPEFLAALMQSDWPGNVRELQNYVERIMALTPGPVLRPDPMPRDLEQRGARIRIGRGRRLADVVEEVEVRLIREALDRSGGNQSLAARTLGLNEQSLRYRLRKYAAVYGREKRRTRQKRRV
jgi:Nif-specific regulatory protein